MRKIFLFLSLLSPLTCCAQFAASAGTTPADSIAAKKALKKLAGFYGSHIQEQAYLQFDKPYYAAGDTIYFKAYITIGDQYALSDMSRILYADLVGPDNQVKKSLTLGMVAGTAWGDFALADTLPKGNYRVRAYTRWMLNGQTGNYFDRVIPIGLAAGKISEAMTGGQQTASQADVQFMPEGGTLASDVKSKIAFKVVGNDGLGVNIKGEVVDNQNIQVCTFTSAHLGMGYFDLFPEEGKTYRAKITYPNGTKNTFALPTPDPKGISLAVDNDFAANAIIRVGAGKAFYAANKDKHFTVLIYSGGEVSTYICTLDARQIVFGVSKKKLHTGVATVTMFSALGEPLAERLIFVQHNDQLNLNISADKAVYAKRGKVNLKLNVKDKNAIGAIGQFSVSVTDENLIPVDENKENTILTDLLLTNDLKGYVEQPNYYFANVNDKTIRDLDLVMLTQGYRKFQWEKILKDNYPPITLQPEKSLEINGIAKSLNGKPLINGRVSLFQLAGGGIMNDTTADDGSFHFRNLAFMDSSRFMLKAMSAKSRTNTSITYVNSPQPAPTMADTNLVYELADLNSPPQAYLENSRQRQEDLSKYGQLSGIVLKTVKINGQAYKSSNLGGAGYADQVITRDKFPNSGGVFSQQFNGRLMGVKFVGDEGNKNPYLMIPRTLSRKNVPMLVVLDGVEEMSLPTDSTGVSTGISLDGLVDVNDIETVEVLTSAATENAYGMSGGSGVLVITTRRGDDKDPLPSATGLLTIRPRGFYKAREFYSPKYDHATTGFQRKDLRSTIYWKPQLVTDKDGNASFDYYNADGTGSYRVVVEGMDYNGNLGRQVFHYKVE